MSLHNFQDKLERAEIKSTSLGFFDTPQGKLLGHGVAVPQGGAVGWAPGALFLHTDCTGAADAVYMNAGTKANANFNSIVGEAALPDDLDLGASGYAGSLNIFPSTASKGKLRFVAANSGGDTVTTVTNASQAAARTYTVPDAGADASFVMTAGAQTVAGVKTYSSVGQYGTAAGATGIALTGTDPDQVLQAHGKMTSAVASGAYAGAYNSLSITATQTNDVSAFGTWSELYLTGNITLISNHAAAWANIELADAGSAITLPGNDSQWHCALAATVKAPDGLVVSSGGTLAALMARSELTAGYTDTGAIIAGLVVNKGAANAAWPYGIYIVPTSVEEGIVVGAEAFTTAGSGIVVDGVTRHSGCEFYFDDGGVKLAAGYTEAFRTGYLVSTAITQADVSLYTAHDYVYLAESVTTAGGVGGTWGSMLVKSGATITTSSGVCDFSGAHFTCDVPSGATIGINTWACGVSVGGNLGGTHTGKAAGYRVRIPGAGKWDVGLRVEPTSSVKAIEVGAEAFADAGSGIPVNGVTLHSGAEFYFDDGGVSLETGYTEAFRTGYLVSQAITGVDASIYTSHDYIYLADSVSTAGGVGATWASLLAKTGAVLTTASGMCDFSAFNASCDVPLGATIGTGTFVAGISMGGNLGGDHTGNAVAFRVRTPSAGKWDGLCDIPAALTNAAPGGGTDKYIDCFIGGQPARIVAALVGGS